jgi:hypothetical protein
MTQTIVKNVHQEYIVKVEGTNTDEYILLSELIPVGQVQFGLVANTRVNIVGVTWTGDNGSVITIKRNNVTIMTLQANASNQLDFGGQLMVPDTIANNNDIVVSISGGQAECYLKLHKVGGYRTTIEPEQYGPYDNPDVAGS